MTTSTGEPPVLELMTRIVSAYVANNPVAPDSLPSIIASVCASISEQKIQAKRPARPQPAVPIHKSVKPDYIICLENGEKYRTLGSVLKRRYSMTPEQYRERWGLPSDYPMVAPSLSAQRSESARQAGLGRKARPRRPGQEEGR